MRLLNRGDEAMLYELLKKHIFTKTSKSDFLTLRNFYLGYCSSDDHLETKVFSNHKIILIPRLLSTIDVRLVHPTALLPWASPGSHTTAASHTSYALIRQTSLRWQHEPSQSLKNRIYHECPVCESVKRFPRGPRLVDWLDCGGFVFLRWEDWQVWVVGGLVFAVGV